MNVIIGRSDHGKSSIIRALYWLVFNRPGGEDFIQWGEKKTEVLCTVDSLTVDREKGGKNSYYVFNDKPEPGPPLESFSAIGKSVPIPIQNILNMNELNFKLQFDSPFLLSMSPSETARYLNNIVHLDKIDTAFSNLRSMLFKERAEYNSAEKNMQHDTEQLESYPSPETSQERKDRLIQYRDSLGSAQQKALEISKINTVLDELVELKEELKEIHVPVVDMDALIEKNALIETKRKEKHTLNTVYTTFNQLKEELKEINVPSVNIDQLLKNSTTIETKRKEKEAFENILEELMSLYEEH
jgi:hypothetical protein